jgi:hypothetical protein
MIAQKLLRRDRRRMRDLIVRARDEALRPDLSADVRARLRGLADELDVMMREYARQSSCDASPTLDVTMRPQ